MFSLFRLLVISQCLGRRSESHRQLVRDLAREFADFLAAVLLHRSTAGVETVSDLGNHILACSVAAAVMPALLQALAWPDSPTAHRVISTLTSVVLSGVGTSMSLFDPLARLTCFPPTDVRLLLCRCRRRDVE